jgi:hypothetical protein
MDRNGIHDETKSKLKCGNLYNSFKILSPEPYLNRLPRRLKYGPTDL